MTNHLNQNEKTVKQQFNKQAQLFDDWQVTQDEELQRSFFEFAGLKSNDNLLEVACGTGIFSTYAARRIRNVVGIDISERMIEIAGNHAKNSGLNNVEFACQQGSKIPFDKESFSAVTSKSAFHHIQNYDRVFTEMVRVCQPGGRICIQDIVAYESEELDRFFEEIEVKIDASHYRTLGKRDIFNQYKKNGVTVKALFENLSDLNFEMYVAQANQSEEDKISISNIIADGLKNTEISRYFYRENGALMFKRKVFIIVGEKSPG